MTDASVLPQRETLAALIDRSPWTVTQKLILGLLCLTVVLDGFDNFALGLVIPSMAAEWGVSRGAFGLVFALGLASLSLGTVVAGPLGDRLGRRGAMIVSVVIFALATLATAWADNLTHLTALRVLAGLGLGGALPNATAIVAELTPMRRRSFAVTLAAVSVPAGGVLAGLVAAEVLPVYGWRGLFVIAGAAPLLLAPLLFIAVPSSPAQALAKPAKLHRLLARIGVRTDSRVTLVLEDNGPRQRRMTSLFQGALLRETSGLCVAFFCSLTVGYMLSNWIPSILASAGHGAVETSRGLFFYSVGGVAGAILAATQINRFGSKLLILVALAAVAINVAISASLALEVTALPVVFLLLTLAGAAVNASSAPLFALAAHVYPAPIRASGIGFALAFGRLGAVASGFLGGIAIDDPHSAPIYFGGAALIMLGTAAGLVLMRRHIPGRSAPTD